MELAEEIVSIYHDQSAAQEARAHFQKVFQRHQLPDEMPIFELDSPMTIVNVMAAAGMTRSKGEARRLVQQNAVSLDGVKISTIEHLIEPAGEQVLRVGRRRFVRIMGK